MKMFLRLGVFVFLGIVFLFVVGPADGQDSLYVVTAGGQAEYDIGDLVEVIFFVEPIDSVALYIEARGMHITSIVGATTTVNPIVSGNYATDSKSGALIVKGIITSSDASISARWDRGAAANFLTATSIPRQRTDVVCEIPPLAPPKATTLLIVSGYGQEGLAGTRLQSPFVVEVRDQYGNPFSGANVVFRVTGGSLSSTRATTNSFGQAQTTLTLGPSAGANSVEASVAGISPSQTFTATATASGQQRRATTLSIVSGNNQSGESGMSLGQAFIVGVKDQSAKPLSGIRVTFRITAGRGQLSTQQVDTGSFGLARTTLTLGRSAGANSVEARVTGISPSQTFTATAIAPGEQQRATTLSIVSGNNQSGESGMSLGQAFIVGVLDQDKRPLDGIPVTFSVTEGGGQLSSQTSQMTNEYGQSGITLTLGDEGINKVNASVNGISHSQTFTATATARAEPEPVVPGQFPSVYWIEGGALYYRPTGGEKTMLWKPRGGTLTGSLAVDMEGGRIYWTEQTGNNSGRIRSAYLDGTELRELVQIENGVPYGITVGTDKNYRRWVYWTTSLGKIQRINVDSLGFKRSIIVGLNSPKHIAFDESAHKLYWAEADRIMSANPNGINRNLVQRVSGELGDIAVADGVVYWTEKTGNGQGKIRSVNSNGSASKLLVVLESVPERVAVDTVNGKLYWTTSDGEIQSALLTGAIQTVVMGLGAPAGLALGHATAKSTAAAPSAAVPSTIMELSEENTLLVNYPNPFNPETWIPYQLSESADVTVSIYSVNGSLIRTLALGHQAAGLYRSRSRAAYWDGRNAFGERVASGLYFYTLTAGDFTATRKMLIR